MESKQLGAEIPLTLGNPLLGKVSKLQMKSALCLAFFFFFLSLCSASERRFRWFRRETHPRGVSGKGAETIPASLRQKELHYMFGSGQMEIFPFL